MIDTTKPQNTGIWKPYPDYPFIEGSRFGEVRMKDQQAVTTSLQVAETFGKRHKNVIQAIENKIQSAENSADYQNMFAKGTYKDSKGRTYPMYYMNRDGFTLLAMGFTGKKAMKFKLEYIEAFNSMEKQIKSEMSLDGLTPTEQWLVKTAQGMADHRRELNRQINPSAT